MSLSTVMARVCRECGIKELASVVSNTDRTAVELLQFCIDAGKEIAKRVEWPALYRETTLTGGSSSYTLPADFHRLIQGGAVRLVDTVYIPVLPAKSADNWGFLSANPSSQPFYFLTSSTISFSPVVPMGGAVVRYVSKNWIEGGQSSFVADTDEADFSEDLLALGTIRNFRQAKSLPSQQWVDDFEALIASEAQAAKGL